MAIYKFWCDRVDLLNSSIPFNSLQFSHSSDIIYRPYRLQASQNCLKKLNRNNQTSKKELRINWLFKVLENIADWGN